MKNHKGECDREAEMLKLSGEEKKKKNKEMKKEVSNCQSYHNFI